MSTLGMSTLGMSTLGMSTLGMSTLGTDTIYLKNRGDFDISSTQNGDEVLRPFSRMTDPKMQRAYSYWMNADMDYEVAQKTLQECAEEVEFIRKHLWNSILKEREEYAKNQSPNWIGRLVNAIDRKKKSITVIGAIILIGTAILGLCLRKRQEI